MWKEEGMILHYLNDENIQVKVYLNDLHSAPTILEAEELGMFELDLVEGHTVFIKRWPNGMILISTMEPYAP
jgi:hypothetical protein